jgi:hypothetical protein
MVRKEGRGGYERKYEIRVTLRELCVVALEISEAILGVSR